MKKIPFLRLAGLAASLLLPLMASAQANVKSAFDAIINCKGAIVSESHALDRDPSTNIKNGQSDIYEFELPGNKFNLIENVIKAFRKDSDMAYSLNSGTLKGKERVSLAVGDGSGSGAVIRGGGNKYLYALYLAPKSENPDGIYRYAYGISYQEVLGDYRGQLVVTYATTLKHRQEMQEKKNIDMLNNIQQMTLDNNSEPGWYDKVMNCLQSMPQANTKTRIALANQAFKYIKDRSNYPDVTKSDTDAISNILVVMTHDSKYSDSVLNMILKNSVLELSKD